MSQQSLHRFDIRVGIIEPGAEGMTQHMTVDHRQEEGICLIACLQNLTVAVIRDIFQCFVQRWLCPDFAVIIQEDKVVVSIDIAKTDDSVNVLKTLFLLKYVRNIPLTSGNIASLMVNDNA